MQRKRGVSEPCGKAESGSQTAYNKRIAGLSVTVPMVQIPTCFGTPQNANAPWRHFWQGYPPNAHITAHASEPEQNSKKTLQHIEKLFIVRFQQVSPLVQMRRKREASEPRSKAESGNQPTHNKCVARLSATTPEVQILGGFGTPQIANIPWRCFLQGYPPNTQQNSTGI